MVLLVSLMISIGHIILIFRLTLPAIIIISITLPPLSLIMFTSHGRHWDSTLLTLPLIMLFSITIRLTLTLILLTLVQLFVLFLLPILLWLRVIWLYGVIYVRMWFFRLELWVFYWVTRLVALIVIGHLIVEGWLWLPHVFWSCWQFVAVVHGTRSIIIVCIVRNKSTVLGFYPWW